MGIDRIVPRRQIATIVILFVAIVIVVGYAFLGPLQRINDTGQQALTLQRHTDCVARLSADFELAVGEALQAPPAPNTARDQAAADIVRASEALRHVATICPSVKG